MPEGIQKHIKDLKHQDENVRRSAAKTLGDIGHPNAVPALAELLKDDFWFVREGAANSLGKIGHPDAVPALVEALKDKDWPVRQIVAASLGDIGHSDAVPALVEALKDEQSIVRWTAANSLAAIGAPAMKDLIKAHENAENDKQRELIEGVIEKIQREEGDA